MGSGEKQAFSLLGGPEQGPGNRGSPKQDGKIRGGGLRDFPKIVHSTPSPLPERRQEAKTEMASRCVVRVEEEEKTGRGGVLRNGRAGG